MSGAQSSGCPSWCQLPAGHRLADDQVIHVRMIECVAGGAGSEPLRVPDVAARVLPLGVPGWPGLRRPDRGHQPAPTAT